MELSTFEPSHIPEDADVFFDNFDKLQTLVFTPEEGLEITMPLRKGIDVNLNLLFKKEKVPDRKKKSKRSKTTQIKKGNKENIPVFFPTSKKNYKEEMDKFTKFIQEKSHELMYGGNNTVPNGLNYTPKENQNYVPRHFKVNTFPNSSRDLTKSNFYEQSVVEAKDIENVSDEIFTKNEKFEEYSKGDSEFMQKNEPSTNTSNINSSDADDSNSNERPKNAVRKNYETKKKTGFTNFTKQKAEKCAIF